jgi:hypothetical protein
MRTVFLMDPRKKQQFSNCTAFFKQDALTIKVLRVAWQLNDSSSTFSHSNWYDCAKTEGWPPWWFKNLTLLEHGSDRREMIFWFYFIWNSSGQAFSRREKHHLFKGCLLWKPLVTTRETGIRTRMSIAIEKAAGYLIGGASRQSLSR